MGTSHWPVPLPLHSGSSSGASGWGGRQSSLCSGHGGLYAAVEQYMSDLSDYEDWTAAEARATQILLGSMKVEFAMDIATLPSTQAMWERAQPPYQPSSHALYNSTLQLTRSLQQPDSPVDTV